MYKNEIKNLNDEKNFFFNSIKHFQDWSSIVEVYSKSANYIQVRTRSIGVNLHYAIPTLKVIYLHKKCPSIHYDLSTCYVGAFVSSHTLII